MKKILELTTEYGTFILLVFVLLIFIDTCGVKSSVEKVSKRQDKLERTVDTTNTILSQKISSEKMDILLKINALEIEREVVYTNNAIVRTSVRPDDIMNKYSSEIKLLEEKLKTTK